MATKTLGFLSSLKRIFQIQLASPCKSPENREEGRQNRTQFKTSFDDDDDDDENTKLGSSFSVNDELEGYKSGFLLRVTFSFGVIVAYLFGFYYPFGERVNGDGDCLLIESQKDFFFFLFSCVNCSLYSGVTKCGES